jgi:hypothetical protein
MLRTLALLVSLTRVVAQLTYPAYTSCVPCAGYSDGAWCAPTSTCLSFQRNRATCPAATIDAASDCPAAPAPSSGCAAGQYLSATGACTSCASGTGSAGGAATACAQCPANTFSFSVGGRANCQPCPSGQTSRPGSALCMPVNPISPSTSCTTSGRRFCAATSTSPEVCCQSDQKCAPEGGCERLLSYSSGDSSSSSGSSSSDSSAAGVGASVGILVVAAAIRYFLWEQLSAACQSKPAPISSAAPVSSNNPIREAGTAV